MLAIVTNLISKKKTKRMTEKQKKKKEQIRYGNSMGAIKVFYCYLFEMIKHDSTAVQAGLSHPGS